MEPINDQPLFLTPIIKKMIWGEEQWGISAHKNGDCLVKTPLISSYSDRTLSELWENNKELWGEAGKAEVFPLLTKLILANDDLSIQVHPDDEYAKANENGSLGKTECWYIVDAKEDATIIIGHNAEDKNELENYIAEGNFEGLIREIPVKKGDFFFIEPGTVHAIKGGTTILETQQNSDITYRLYDYGRLQDGKPRELHINKCLDVIKCPFKDEEPAHREIKEFDDGSFIRNLVTCPYFEVDFVKIVKEAELSRNTDFTLASVIKGGGFIIKGNMAYRIKKGEHFILPYGFGSYKLMGSMELIISGSH